MTVGMPVPSVPMDKKVLLSLVPTVVSDIVKDSLILLYVLFS